MKTGKLKNSEGAIMSKVRIDLPREKIAEFCRKWKIREFALFGSVLHDYFRPGSDIDVIVDFKSGTKHTLFDMVTMTDELRDIFGGEVDLMTRRSVEQSRNYILRKAILSSMEVVYVS